MPIEIPKGLPFSVDTWTPNSRSKRHHFLTHAHKDHSQGILSHASFPIFSTKLTKALLLLFYPPLDDRLFVDIEVGQSLVIDDPDGDFCVTAFDANHCPGAVMFLFEGKFGTILHTGDCRLIPEMLQGLPEKFVSKKGRKPSCQLDYVFLDCTFGRSSFKMPSKRLAIQQVINCIWKHPNATSVYLTCDLLGQEEILSQVYQTFGCKIYVDKEKDPEYFQVLELLVPEILTGDSSSRFHLFNGFPKLYERAETKIAEAIASSIPEPLIIRPSTQWYVCEEEENGFSESQRKRKRKRCDQALRDMYGVWHVCYSMHSSKEELEWALEILKPKWIISTTPSCRATELDYVKKYCSNTSIYGDSLSKLMDITFSTHFSKPNTPVDWLSSSQVGETVLACDLESHTQTQSTVVRPSRKRLLNLSPDSKQPSITLFGRARLGFRRSLCESDKETESKDYISSCNMIEHVEDMKSCREETDKVSLQALESVKFKSEKHLVMKNGVSSCESDKKTESKDYISSSKIIKHVEDIKPCREKAEEFSVQTVEFVKFESENQLAMKNGVSDDTICPSAEVNSVLPVLDESLRRLYQSMNVAVPRPLPSLVEMMKRTRCGRRWC